MFNAVATPPLPSPPLPSPFRKVSMSSKGAHVILTLCYAPLPPFSLLNTPNPPQAELTPEQSESTSPLHCSYVRQSVHVDLSCGNGFLIVFGTITPVWQNTVSIQSRNHIRVRLLVMHIFLATYVHVLVTANFLKAQVSLDRPVCIHACCCIIVCKLHAKSFDVACVPTYDTTDFCTITALVYISYFSHHIHLVRFLSVCCEAQIILFTMYLVELPSKTAEQRLVHLQHNSTLLPSSLDMGTSEPEVSYRTLNV